ncbi:hypothetical protein [Okeania sp. KiyG1]|uniref:hypothetical protein n=1 Tax=Okeania sp. KiyG1 TaxID=2720165 RepID=UPI0019234FA8|nr:hypothetical protein [Okeania sp. KiyG1]
MSHKTRLRYQKTTQGIANDYLEKQIIACRDQSAMVSISYGMLRKQLLAVS